MPHFILQSLPQGGMRIDEAWGRRQINYPRKISGAPGHFVVCDPLSSLTTAPSKSGPMTPEKSPHPQSTDAVFSPV